MKNTEKYKLHTVTLNMEENGYCCGVKPKRDATVHEAFEALEKCLGFNMELFCSEMDDDEYEDYQEDVRETFNDFIKGNADMYQLCNAVQSTENFSDDSFYLGVFVHLLCYLTEKGII